MATNIGEISVTIGANTQKLKQGMSSARRSLEGFRSSITPATKAIAKFTAAATAASAAVAVLTKRGMDNIDAQAKLARQLDSTIGGLRALQLASEDAGVATETINGAMERFSARLGEAQRGTGQAKEALDRLGLSASDLAGMDVDRRVATLADNIKDLGLSGAETADVLRQFGIRNREIVNLMRQGGDAIRDAKDEIEDYGLAIDSVDASTIEAANDALSRVGLVVESIQNALAVELAPIILEVADRFNTAAREAGGWGDVVREAVRVAIEGFVGVADAIHNGRLKLAEAEVAVAKLEYAFAEFASEAWNAVAPFFDGLIEKVNNLIAAINQLPNVDIQPLGEFSSGEFMDQIATNLEKARGQLNLTQMELNKLAEQKLPSEMAEEFFDAIEERRKEFQDSGGLLGSPDSLFGSGENGGSTGASGESEDSDDSPTFAGGEGDQFGRDSINKLLEEQAQARQDILRKYDELDTERQQEKFESDMERLREALELEAITKDEFREAEREAELEHYRKLTGIRQNSFSRLAKISADHWGSEVGLAVDSLGTIVSAMSEQSETMFKISKAAALAGAIIDAYKAITGAYKVGAEIGGPPLGAAFAAAAGAAQFATIAKIRGQQYNGGTSASGSGSAGGSSGGGSGSIGPGSGGGQQQAPQETLVANLSVQGEVFDRKTVIGLIEQINELQTDGMRVRIDT